MGEHYAHWHPATGASAAFWWGVIDRKNHRAYGGHECPSHCKNKQQMMHCCVGFCLFFWILHRCFFSTGFQGITTVFCKIMASSMARRRYAGSSLGSGINKAARFAKSCLLLVYLLYKLRQAFSMTWKFSLASSEICKTSVLTLPDI